MTDYLVPADCGCVAVASVDVVGRCPHNVAGALGGSEGARDDDWLVTVAAGRLLRGDVLGALRVIQQ